jgi:hypothetical protein
MSRTHDVTISAFDLDRLERELAAMTEQRDRLAKTVWSMLDQDDMSKRAGILLRSLGPQSPTNPNEL